MNRSPQGLAGAPDDLVRRRGGASCPGRPSIESAKASRPARR
jgi:hypothetical protein